jgi:hypothetical protein
MRLRTRLQNLERSRTFAGCPACRHRRVIVIRTCTPLPDGNVVGVWDRDEPMPCPRLASRLRLSKISTTK